MAPTLSLGPLPIPTLFLGTREVVRRCPALQRLWTFVEDRFEVRAASCFLNLYRHGADFTPHHHDRYSDPTLSLGPLLTPTIPQPFSNWRFV